MSKKVVHYHANSLGHVNVGHSAILAPVDHPDTDRVSNTTFSVTSPVVRYDSGTGEVETVNTIYKPYRTLKP